MLQKINEQRGQEPTEFRRPEGQSPVRTHAIDATALKGGQVAKPPAPEVKECLRVEGLNLYYGEKRALHDNNMSIPEKRVTAFIGPSGCGKSTLLRCFNRMNDLYPNVRVEGKITLHGRNIYGKSVNVADLRRRVGMVFQKPNPFPKSVY